VRLCALKNPICERCCPRAPTGNSVAPTLAKKLLPRGANIPTYPDRDTLGGRRTDSATRVIAAPPEAIYRAFMDPEAWVKWLPPEGMTGRIYQFEPRPGGSYRMALTYRNVDRGTRGKTSEGTDIEIVPDKQVVRLVTFESDDAIFAGEMKMRWHLSLDYVEGEDGDELAELPSRYCRAKRRKANIHIGTQQCHRNYPRVVRYLSTRATLSP